MDKELERNTQLKLDDSVKTNKRGEAILGVLKGVCADCFSPTRNKHLYSDELWENVFNDPLVNEAFECGGILGELDHPTDRTETCTEKVAVCMPEKPRRNKDGQLEASFDILDTPNGRIVYTLAKYGYKLGVSSRGDGDLVEDFSGQEKVDPESYQLQGFDIVLTPAVKAARLTLAESLQNGKSLKQALTEQLDKSNTDERKVMEETLSHLNIDYSSTQTSNKIEESVKLNSESADGIGEDMFKELQRCLKENKALNEQLMTLQEKLSVCNAKEQKYEQDISRYKSTVINLSETAKSVKSLKEKIASMEEQLQSKDKEVNKLLESQKKSFEGKRALVESTDSKVAQLNARISQLKENLRTQQATVESEKQSLTEKYEKVKKDFTLYQSESNRKLQASQQLVERYKKVASAAVDQYIEAKATMIGITKQEIKNKLSESYSFKDIDSVCESLQKFKVNMNRLPFSIDEGKQVVAKVNPAVVPTASDSKYDDVIDSDLINLVKNKK